MSTMIVAAAIVLQAPLPPAPFKKTIKWMKGLAYKAPKGKETTTHTYQSTQRHIVTLPTDAPLYLQAQVK